MHRIQSPTGVTVSYGRYGSGPPLVLVHGAFSNHVTNWELVEPMFEASYTVYAIARRGRGETDATEGHTLEDEGRDAAAVIESIGAPVFLLGHSYGAHTALVAAALAPSRVSNLVLYEPAWPRCIGDEVLAPLERLASAGDWDGFALSFFRDALSVRSDDLAQMRRPEIWAPIVADASATLHDLRALNRYRFVPERFRDLRMPVLLQIGTESPRDLYTTDALAAVLPDARIGALEGQAHEGMTTAPDLYAEAVTRFLLG